jgi:midasin (ATPase involved in ribosome maturation)
MNSQQRLVDALKASGKAEFTRPDIVAIAQSLGVNPSPFLSNHANKVRRGLYAISGNVSAPVAGSAVPTPHRAAPAAVAPTAMLLAQPKLHVEVSNLVPNKDATYVPFGFHKDLATIVSSKAFYPVFITGLSGNGKTTMVEQVCAALKRECIRVNISIETDEDDLIGGNTLVDGNVVYREGPVSLAMKRGAILILDECDRGSNKLMCLQAILEGKPYFNKKTGETIYPTPGFNIVATANTKGQGADEGKYMSAQILDDAFLERFAVTIEQEYPSSKVEKKIIMKKMQRVEKVDEDFADKLVAWAEIIRKTFKEGAIDDLISTRRLEHIVNAFAMFGDRMKAIDLCIARFDAETKMSFLDLYTKVDSGAEMPGAPTEEAAPSEEDLPF